MSKAIYYFKNDFRGAVWLAVNNARRAWIRLYSGLVFRMKAQATGVIIGKNISQGGVMRVERFPMSRIEIGDGCSFNSCSLFNQRGIKRCIIQTGTSEAVIRIGRRCGFSGVSIVADKEVEIGDNVMVGANTLIGDRDDHPGRLHTSPAKITIKDNVFIGMHCMVMKGVTIGENSIIAAGSIVTKDIPANCVAAGIPCKVIRQM